MTLTLPATAPTPPGPAVGATPTEARSAAATVKAAPPASREAGGAARPTIIGLDLSLRSTGIASSIGWTDTITPPDTYRGVDRMRWIFLQLKTYLTNGTTPALVVIEGPAYGVRAQQGTHERAGLWWLVRYHLDIWTLPTAVVPPTVLKQYATGNGNAGKPAMVAAAREHLYRFDGGHDEADAAWLAAMGSDHLGHRIATIPAHRRAYLLKATWPELLSQ